MSSLSRADHVSSDLRVKNALASLATTLDVLCGVDVHDLAVETLHVLVREVETAFRRLAGVNAAVLTAVEADGRWATDGSRSIAAWVRRATDASPGRAHRQTRTARALRDHLPVTAAALTAGMIGTEHAELIAKHTTTSPARRAALDHAELGEAFLVEQAEQYDAATFQRLVRRWAIAADPEVGDKEHRDQHDKEHVVLAKTLDGYHLQGWLTEVSGATLAAALRAREGVPDAGDQRTPGQRRAGALVSLARQALDSGALTPGAAIRPHITVHVPYDTLQRLADAQAPEGAADRQGSAAADSDSTPISDGGTGTAGATCSDGANPAGSLSWRGRLPAACTPGDDDHSSGGTHGPVLDRRALAIPGGLDHAALVGAAPAELDDGTPLAHAQLARLTCDSELARVIFGPKSEILDSGRKKRLFTPGQRRAIIARDRHCQYPGCDAPPGEGEIHHSIWWYAQYGQTRARDGLLLCWHHHDHVHAHQITIERTPPGQRKEDGGASPGPGIASDHTESGDARWTFRRPNGRLITAQGRSRWVPAV